MIVLSRVQDLLFAVRSAAAVLQDLFNWKFHFGRDLLGLHRSVMQQRRIMSQTGEVHQSLPNLVCLLVATLVPSDPNGVLIGLSNTSRLNVSTD